MKHIKSHNDFSLNEAKKEFRDVDMDKQFANPWYEKIRDKIKEIAIDEWNMTVYLLPHYKLGSFRNHPNA